MNIGPIMMDLAGVELTLEEHEKLQHPLIGGVILFTRNYVDVEQITHLVSQIHQVKQPQLLVAVDHEGGGFSVFV